VLSVIRLTELCPSAISSDRGHGRSIKHRNSSVREHVGQSRLSRMRTPAGVIGWAKTLRPPEEAGRGTEGPKKIRFQLDPAGPGSKRRGDECTQRRLPSPTSSQIPLRRFAGGPRRLQT